MKGSCFSPSSPGWGEGEGVEEGRGDEGSYAGLSAGRSAAVFWNMPGV